jgi:hypothetical protein
MVQQGGTNILGETTEFTEPTGLLVVGFNHVAAKISRSSGTARNPINGFKKFSLSFITRHKRRVLLPFHVKPHEWGNKKQEHVVAAYG